MAPAVLNPGLNSRKGTTSITMKSPRLTLALAALAAFLPLQSYGDEALDDFKEEVAAGRKLVAEFEKKSKESPMESFAKFGEMVAAIKEIETDELPADLRTPWLGVVGCLEKMAVVVGEMPKDAAALEKKTSDNAFMEAFSKKMDAINTELKPHIEKLKAAGKKYGIEGLDEFAPK